MMLKPSIDSLLDRVNSKYSLVILASKRAHELDAGATATLEDFESVKSVGQALEEIDAETVIVDPHPEVKRARIRLEEEERKAKKEQEQKSVAGRNNEMKGDIQAAIQKVVALGSIRFLHTQVGQPSFIGTGVDNNLTPLLSHYLYLLDELWKWKERMSNRDRLKVFSAV